MSTRHRDTGEVRERESDEFALVQKCVLLGTRSISTKHRGTRTQISGRRAVRQSNRKGGEIEGQGANSRTAKADKSVEFDG